MLRFGVSRLWWVVVGNRRHEGSLGLWVIRPGVVWSCTSDLLSEDRRLSGDTQ